MPLSGEPSPAKWAECRRPQAGLHRAPAHRLDEMDPGRHSPAAVSVARACASSSSMRWNRMSGSIGREKRKPCASSQPMRRSVASCSERLNALRDRSQAEPVELDLEAGNEGPINLEERDRETAEVGGMARDKHLRPPHWPPSATIQPMPDWLPIAASVPVLLAIMLIVRFRPQWLRARRPISEDRVQRIRGALGDDGIAEVRQLADERRRIEAIRLVVERTGASLDEAMAVLDDVRTG